MKNMKKLVAMMLIILSVFFFACEDDEPEPLSPEKAKAELADLSAEMSTDFADMQEAEGMVAMQALMNMPDPFEEPAKSGVKTAVISNIYESLIPFSKEIKTKSAYKSDGFDFDAHKGTYTWNSNTQWWDKTTNANYIVIIFPTEGSTTNNAELTISKYTEDTYFNPTEIEAKLEVNDIKVIEIDFSATWEIDDPKSLDVSIFLKPFTFDGGFNLATTSASANFSIIYNTTKIFSTNLSVTFTDDTQDDIKKITGYIQYRDIKISAAINLYNIEKIREELGTPMSSYTTLDEALEAINKEIDAKVTKNGALVAEIELAFNTDTSSIYPIIPVLVFSDGSSEPAMPYFESFITSIQEFFDFLDSYFNDDTVN